MTAARLLSPEDALAFKADAAIVGTGAGSMAVAGELGRRGMRVIMLEAGPALDGDPGRHRRNVHPDDQAFMSELMVRIRPHANRETPVPGLPGAGAIHSVGGMFSYWTHMVPRPHRDLEWAGPLPFDIVERFFEQAEELLWANTALFGEGSPRQQWVQAELSAQFGAQTVGPAVLAGRRGPDDRFEWASGDNLLQGAEHNVAILPNAIVQRVVFAGDRAQALEALCTTESSKITVEADVFVVGGGLIGTPQVLFASGVRDLPALGGYMTDHLNIVTQVMLKDDAPVDPEGATPVWLHLPVAPGRDCQVGVLDLIADFKFGYLAEVDPMKVVNIGVFIGTDPVARNRLVFDASRSDAFGLPAVSAEIDLTEGDNERAKDALALAYEVSAAIGQPWYGMNPMIRPYGSSVHTMGTYRIGTDAETSVADANSRVWGYENLYVAGNGVIPTKNHCNPSLTTIAVGLVAGSAIAGEPTASG